jgi:hypothetical protein
MSTVFAGVAVQECVERVRGPGQLVQTVDKDQEPALAD